jgi:hypothetical protein
LNVSWSGCASGSGLSANCVINGLGSFTAKATVTDSAGKSKSAQVSLEGKNGLPQLGTVACGSVGGLVTAISGSFHPGDSDNDPLQVSVDPSGGISAFVRIGNTFTGVMLGFGNETIAINASDSWGTTTRNCSYHR